MSKITVKHDIEDFTVRILQEGMPGLAVNEGYLELLLRAIKNPKYRNIYFNGIFRVQEHLGSIIITSFDKRTKSADDQYRPLLILTKDKAEKFTQVVESQLGYVLSEYSLVMV